MFVGPIQGKTPANSALWTGLAVTDSTTARWVSISEARNGAFVGLLGIQNNGPSKQWHGCLAELQASFTSFTSYACKVASPSLVSQLNYHLNLACRYIIFSFSSLQRKQSSIAPSNFYLNVRSLQYFWIYFLLFTFYFIVVVRHHSNFPKTTKLHVSWLAQEQASPHSEASGNRDYMTSNTKVGSSHSFVCVTSFYSGFSLLHMKL